MTRPPGKPWRAPPGARLRSFALALLLAGTAGAEDAPTLPFTIDARPVALSADAPAGQLAIRGMLELPVLRVNGLRFAELSGLAWDDDESLLYAITDQGGLFTLRPVFTGDTLTGLILVAAHPLRELKTGKPVRYRRTDAEGLDIVNGRNGKRGDSELIVSFEREPRIIRYTTDGRPLGEYSLPAALRTPGGYAGDNRMLEAVCHDPALGMLVAPEEPLRDEAANQESIFSLAGRRWRLPREEGGITAMECLGNGELLVLRRLYNPVTGRKRIRFRHLRLAARQDTATAETIAVFDSDAGHSIDNFEGLARHRARRFFVVSDNNDVFIQRTLLLVVEWREPPAGR